MKVWIPRLVFAVSCFFALYISWFASAVLSFGGMPLHVTSARAWIFDRYLLAVMVFPCCLFALIKRWWSTMPLWLGCSWIALLPQFLNGDLTQKWGYPLGFLGRNGTIEMACIMILPVIVQIASATRKSNEPVVWSATRKLTSCATVCTER